MSHAFNGIKNRPVIVKTSSSPEEAAFLLWGKKKLASLPEPASYEGHLYKIDLGTITIKEIPIPKISFQV